MSIHTSKKKIPLLLPLTFSILQNSLTLISTMHQMVHTCGKTFPYLSCLTFVYMCRIQVRIKSRYIIKELFSGCDWFGVCLWDGHWAWENKTGWKRLILRLAKGIDSMETKGLPWIVSRGVMGYCGSWEGSREMTRTQAELVEIQVGFYLLIMFQVKKIYLSQFSVDSF